jgi:acyl-coenzyme A synthetase/AMP-(fatty) acid ligase
LLHNICYIYDNFRAASDLGWIVGHSYCCYGPLAARNTTILYEVGTKIKVCAKNTVLLTFFKKHIVIIIIIELVLLYYYCYKND